MIVQALPGGSVVLDAEALEVTYMVMVAGVRQLRVDGLTTPNEVRAVLSSIQAQVKATRAGASDRGRPPSDDPAPSGLMTIAEAAPLVGRHERTLARWAAEGRLPSARQAHRGAPWLVSIDEAREVAGS